MWMLFAFLAAFSWATADLFSKRLMNFDGKSEYVTLFARFIFSLPLLFVVYLATSPHRCDVKFWLVNLVIIPGDVVASTLYIKALKLSPISIVVPLMSFAPVFMLLSSPIFLGEWPSPAGVLGVIMVTVGAYTLNINLSKYGIWEPLKALFKDKGPLYTIIAAAIFSVDTAFGKKAIYYSDVYFFSFWYSLLMSVAYLPVVYKNSKGSLADIFKDWKFYAVGVLFGVGVLSFLVAIKLANIAYVSALGKVSMVIAVLYGKFFLGEESFKERLLGVFIMLAGIFLIFYAQLLK